MGTKTKKTVKYFFLLLTIGMIGFGGVYFYNGKIAEGMEETKSYLSTQTQTGEIEKNVSGTGSLSMSTTDKMLANFPISIEEKYVKNGSQVVKGDNLLRINKEALKETIENLQSELEENTQKIINVGGNYAHNQKIKATAKGRIKELYGEVGDQLEKIMDLHNGIALLSLDGKMNISIKNQGYDLSLGDTVSIKRNNDTYVGEVEKIDGEEITILFSDKYVLEGEEVTVHLNGEEIATAQAKINMPFVVNNSNQGRISEVSLEVNNTVTTNSTLYQTGQVPIPKEYDELIEKQNTLEETLEQAKGLLDTETIVSDYEGVIESISDIGEEIEKGEAIVSIYTGNEKEMEVSIDELDITNVKTGQKVSIKMDAMTDKLYEGTVDYISQIGTNANGVTTYAVTVQVYGDENLKLGMNGTATIQIETAKNILVLPVEALNDLGNNQFVWLKDESAQGEESNLPGIMTYVTTGLSDGSKVEITSGLEEGDEVIIVKGENQKEDTGIAPMAMMDSMGAERQPSGGMPQGERPSGGGPR